MFYLLVPDPTGVVNSNKRSTAQVLTLSSGTVAHEYQHLINASRRMYVNGGGAATEEKWLDEGLAHTAEELNFFRSSGRSPRANLDATGFADPKFATAYSTFEVNNFNRYKSYLTRTELQAPTGFDGFDDDLPTRGAIWNFLRFAADRLPAGQENAFWFNLVNSKISGIANLTAALGTPPSGLLHDWAISVFLDDNAVNVDPLNTYSTYTHEGLPPGPIANPGIKSMQAVLAPASTKYLYFVTRGEARRHAFSETVEEHNTAVKDLRDRTHPDAKPDPK